MSGIMNDFAYRYSSRIKRGLRGASGRRSAVLLRLAVAFVVLTGSGCATLGDIGNSMMFWRGDDDNRVVGGKSMSPEDIEADLLVTGEQMRNDPLEPYWPYHMGELQLARGNASEAVPFLQGALEDDPAYAPAVALLSKIYYDQRKHEEAITLLDGFIASHPGAPDALRAALALHLEAVGDLDAANATLDAGGNSREVRAARTFVALRGYQEEPILDTARRALDDDPGSAVNHNNYGIALLFAGQPDEARKSFMKALKIDGNLPGAMYNMAIVEAFYFFDEDTARNWFERYEQVANDDPDNLRTILGTKVSRLEKENQE